MNKIVEVGRVNLPLVTIQKLSQESGYTVGALRRKIERGQLLQGIHWAKSPDGRIQFNVEAWNKWVSGDQASSHAA